MRSRVAHLDELHSYSAQVLQESGSCIPVALAVAELGCPWDVGRLERGKHRQIPKDRHRERETVAEKERQTDRVFETEWGRGRGRGRATGARRVTAEVEAKAVTTKDDVRGGVGLQVLSKVHGSRDATVSDM